MVAPAATGLADSSAAPAGRRQPARIGVMPAFNEAATIEAVLDDLIGRIDFLIVVNDGSVDDTGTIVDGWMAGRERCRAIHFPENRGLSAALRAGWDEVRAMIARGEVRADDVAFSIDADGQHEPAAIDGMIDFLVEHDLACVIGRRDLSYHSRYKLFGNRVMTWIGCLSGGHRFDDIESGYRVFRVGPLLEAQEYYRGYRYSETVEVAVLLTRMGYAVDNTHLIHIPVARTRTRLSDAAVDAVCMPLAWFRLACWRGVPAVHRFRAGAWAGATIPAIWAFTLLAMLTHAFYLGDDSAHSYAHVWYLSESLFTRHELPLHVSQLSSGDALMFPYAVVPWFPSALVYPVLGNWVVTLSMVLGLLLLVRGMWAFRPAMRNPVLFAMFLLNPLLWNGVTQFQLATMWAFAFFFFGVALFERRRWPLAALFFVLAIAAHPIMGLAAIGLYGAGEWSRTRSFPVRLAVVAAASAAIASPALVFFFATPSFHEASPGILALSAVDNMRRLTIVLLPLVLAAFSARVFAHQRLILAAGAVGTLAVLVVLPPSGLWERSHPRFADYLAQNPIVPGDSYRVLTTNNHEDGMFELMKAGAILSHEFFTEGIHRQNFASTQGYVCFLATTKVDHVLFTGEYIRLYQKNEPALLDEMVRDGSARLEFKGADGTLAYRVSPPVTARKGSLNACDY